MAAKHNIVGKGSGKRRHFRGKMVLPDGSPRAHSHGGHSQAFGGWERGQDKVYTTKHIPGQFRAPAPTKRVHRKGFYRSAV